MGIKLKVSGYKVRLIIKWYLAKLIKIVKLHSYHHRNQKTKKIPSTKLNARKAKQDENLKSKN